ncbi:MAG: hypothetical protein AB4038_21125 [Prochloraceae cyanobacterium]
MQVTVVNMIPNALSNETKQDSEPNLAVNPANPLEIVGSALTENPMEDNNAPIYVSTDGGDTWFLNAIVPSQVRTVDITVRYSGTGQNLYAGILRLPDPQEVGIFNILRTNNPLGPNPTTVLVDREGVDQPYIQAATVLGGVGTARDRVYVGINEVSQHKSKGGTGKTASVDLSLDAANATPPPPSGFKTNFIEKRSTWGQNGASIRPVIHPDGTLYAIFYGWRDWADPIATTDVVVVRDDNWGIGTNPFSDLIDPSDGLAGRIVVTGRTVPFANDPSPSFGQERFACSNVTIAVDPRDSDIVYIAWADRVATTDYTLHVRRSTDRGVTWSKADLRTITNATNPALAINSRGRVGFLYQQLTGTGKNQRWETHVELTINNWTTSNNLVLANVPANRPIRIFKPYIGDYLHLMAVGKDFYGIFSANNTPDHSNFPHGVTYQRNANFTTNTLLDLDNIKPVEISIDPFFFRVTETEVPASSDFYVRDWTDSSNVHDIGLEPSSRGVFYTTSDVWNRRSDAAGEFDANDRPQNENAQVGNNFGFTRVHRNVATTSETVTAHFLYSEFGTGNNYQNTGTVPDPTLTFAVGDLVQTMTSGYPWQLSSTSSKYFCWAVEISTPNDPIIAPSLLGRAPGWPTNDLLVINDNNKAQRNMKVSAISGTGQISFYAIVHNAATFPRNITLRYEAPLEVQQRLGRIKVELIGKPIQLSVEQVPVKLGTWGRQMFVGLYYFFRSLFFRFRSRSQWPWCTDSQSKLFKSGDTITISDMQPGENRWIGLTFDAPKGEDGELLPIYFSEMVGNKAVNGFAIASYPSPLVEAIRENIDLHWVTLNRILSLVSIEEIIREEAIRQTTAAQQLLSQDSLSQGQYIEFLKLGIPIIEKFLTDELNLLQSCDPMATKAALGSFTKAIGSGDIRRIAPTHSALLHKLDAFITMQLKMQGDPADILQNISWMIDLYNSLPQLENLGQTLALLEQSQEFVRAYENKLVGNEDYPELIRNLLDTFQETAIALKQEISLENAITTIKQHLDSPTALQKAHRDYLLSLQYLANS